MSKTIGGLTTTLFAGNISTANQVEFGVGFDSPEDSQKFPFDELLAYAAGLGLDSDQSGMHLDFDALPENLSPNVATDFLEMHVAGGTPQKVRMNAIIQPIGGTDLSLGTTTLTTVDIDSSTGTNATLVAATSLAAGLMTGPDRDKLDGIADSANNYAHPDHGGDVSGTGDGPLTVIANAITTTKIADANVTLAKLAPDAITNLSQNVPGSSGGVELVNSTGTNTEILPATSSLPGVMVETDKAKLDSAINLAEFGVDLTGATPNSTQVQNALNTGRDIFLPDGTVQLEAPVTLTVEGQAIYGTGQYRSRFLSTMSLGENVISTNGFQFYTLKDFSVYGQTVTSPYQNCVGIHANSARGYIANVFVRYCATGWDLNGAFILTAVNMWARSCGTGAKLTTVNNADISLHTEACNKPLEMLTCSSVRLDYMQEGLSGAPLAASTIDNARGINFTTFYCEYTVTPSTPEVIVGGSSLCEGITFEGINAQRSNSPFPLIECDQVNGLHIGRGRHSGGTWGEVLSVTANSRNVTNDLMGSQNNTELRECMPTPTHMMQPVQNLFPDPRLLNGLPLITSANNANTVALDGTTVPLGVNQSIAVTATGAGTNVFIGFSFDLTRPPFNQLLGQRVGVGAFIHAPNTANFQSNQQRCSVWVNTDTGSSSNTENRMYLPGKWVMAWNRTDVPANANSLELRLYANQSSDPIPGEVVHFAMPCLWVGGENNLLKYYRGELLTEQFRDPIGPQALWANTASTPDLVKEIIKGSLTPATPGSGDVALGWTAGGDLREFDLTSTSRVFFVQNTPPADGAAAGLYIVTQGASRGFYISNGVEVVYVAPFSQDGVWPIV